MQFSIQDRQAVGLGHGQSGALIAEMIDEDNACGSNESKAAHFFAGAAAGVISDVTTHPLDAAATHAQSGTQASSLRALYRGFGVAAVMSAPAYAMYFSTYETARNSGIHPAAAGCFAEAGGGLFFVPCEVLKKRAVLGTAGYTRLRGLPVTVAQLVRAEGVRALYAGYFTSVAAWAPFSAVYFWCFEAARKRVLVDRRGQDLACGSIAGATAAFVTAPIDLVATRVQTRHGGARTVSDVVRGIVRNDGLGVRPFFRGAGARVVWLAPEAAVAIWAFEYLKRLFDRAVSDG